MNQSNKKLLIQGTFAFVAVAIIGATTAVYAATNNTQNNTSGYGSGVDNALDASAQFDVSYANLSSGFEEDVAKLIADAKAKLNPSDAQAVSQFEATFNQQSDVYDSKVMDASAKFRASVLEAMKTAESKDQFIDAFNNAKAQYFNELDAAKNEFAASLSGSGNDANVAKDQFMNGYNSTRDMYGNDLEAIKNQFADRVTNNN
jgi:hypothetical protein